MKSKIRLSILLLLCSTFIVNTQASLFLKAIGGSIRATGSLMIAGTLVAIGQAQEQIEKENTPPKKLLAHDVIQQWKLLLQNGKKGVTTLHELATGKENPVQETSSEEDHY